MTKIESIIHITDHQTDDIVADITEDSFWIDNHYKSIKNNKEIFDFVTFADKPFSEFLTKRNRIVIPDEDNKLVEFIITNTRKFHKSGILNCEVKTSASYITLKTAKVIIPQTTKSQSAEAHVRDALAGTEWQMGDVAFVGVRTLTFEFYTNPLDYLKLIASEFGLELHFRVESNGNRIVKRYVDLVERIGDWQGREVEFGKDLENIERIEDSSNVVTALLGIGPEREDGSRLTYFAEDEEALQRWGRNGQHIVDIYEPITDDSEMTLDRLKTLTDNELEKRVNSLVQYKADVIDLENVPGLEHEKFRFGDTIRIKDLKFNPPLYLEARVHSISRSIKYKGKKTVELGDFIEYTEEEIRVNIKALQAEIAKKVSMSQVMTYAEKIIPEQPTPPPNPQKGDKWVNTSVNPPQMELYDGENWSAIKGEKGDPGPNKVDENTDIGDNWFIADYIKSLNGLNIGNGQFVVDNSGNASFGGNLNGATGTFSGRITTPLLEVGADNITGFKDFGLRLQAAQWQENGSFKKTGKIDFNTLNNALEVSQIDNTGKYTPLQGFRMNAGTSEFTGNVIIEKVLYFAQGPSLDMSGGSIRLRQSPSNYLLMNTAGSVVLYADGVQRHAFWNNGTKTGGTIEVDGRNLGMSPIDGPQVLIEYIEFDVPLNPDGVKIYLDPTYLKTVEKFAVFPNNGKIIEKGTDYVIISGEGKADIRFVGERIGYSGVFFADMSDHDNSNEGDA